MLSLAAEDDSFFEHRGIVISGLARAAVELVTTGSIRSGGSTITMQVARNFFLEQAPGVHPQVQRDSACRSESKRSSAKQEILSLYTNKIYMGNRAYGVGAAAQVYYGKTLDELSLGRESPPSRVYPRRHPATIPLANSERAMVRRNWILGRMLSLGQYRLMWSIRPPSPRSTTPVTMALCRRLDAAYAAEMVRQEVIE